MLTQPVGKVLAFPLVFLMGFRGLGFMGLGKQGTGATHPGGIHRSLCKKRASLVQAVEAPGPFVREVGVSSSLGYLIVGSVS